MTMQQLVGMAVHAKQIIVETDAFNNGSRFATEAVEDPQEFIEELSQGNIRMNYDFEDY